MAWRSASPRRSVASGSPWAGVACPPRSGGDRSAVGRQSGWLRSAIAAKLLEALGLLVLGAGFLALAGAAWKYGERLLDLIYYPDLPGWRRFSRAFNAGLCALAGVGLLVAAVGSVVEAVLG
jgi:hypothetical protein